MKKYSLFLFLFAMIGAFTIASCGDDETCTDGIQNQDESGVDCGGVCDACPTCTDGIQNGDETGVDCGGSDCDDCLIGLHGEWLSEGDNIAVILEPFASKLEATFNPDGSFFVVQTDTSGAIFNLEGTYVQEESGVDDIWTITLNQSSPTQLTSEGIFSISDDTMMYEIAQTEPAITGVTPPTPEGGFGSTSGGFFGMNNVQVFIRQ